jgi:hypothetical protein
LFKSLNESSFKSTLYIQLLNSYFNLNQIEKCTYYCKKFLRQIVIYLNDQIKYTTSSSSANQSLLGEAQNKFQKFSTDLFEFISNLLEIILK